MNNLKAKVLCRRNEKGTLDFFISFSEKKKEEVIYLFSTDYMSVPIEKEYINGVYLSSVFSKTHKYRQQKIKDRIKTMIRFIEKEYDLNLLKKSKVKNKTVKVEVFDYNESIIDSEIA